MTMNNNEEISADMPTNFTVVPARPQRKTEKTVLPEDYEPSKYSVICGRGKGSYQSGGNVNFRALVKNNLQRYKEAPGRLEKSFIVSEVLNMIRESCPVGAFVKYEKGRWYDLDDTVCREKVGSLFRDFLHTEYKSSSKAKHARKVAEKSQSRSPSKSPSKQTNVASPKQKSPEAVKRPELKSQPHPQRDASNPPAAPKISKRPQKKQGEEDELPTFYDIDDLSRSKLSME